MSYAWQPELFVCFNKFEHFENAMESAFVPTDAREEALDMWAEWELREQYERSCR